MKKYSFQKGDRVRLTTPYVHAEVGDEATVLANCETNYGDSLMFVQFDNKRTHNTDKRNMYVRRFGLINSKPEIYEEWFK